MCEEKGEKTEEREKKRKKRGIKKKREITSFLNDTKLFHPGDSDGITSFDSPTSYHVRRVRRAALDTKL